MANAGRVAIVPKGEYSASVAYKRLDLVRYNNDLYVAKKANTGVAPTDSETWMLSLENVSQTQYDDIINGTTAVGNTKKVNGITLYKSFTEIDSTFSNQTPILDLVAKMADYSKFTVTIYNGSTDVYPVVNGTLEIEKTANNSSYTALSFTERSGSRKWHGTIHGAANYWSGWLDDADGGNADTVDGKHANAFIEREGTRANYLGFTSENGLQINIDGTVYKIPWGMGRTDVAQKTDLAKYLPLDGSVPMSDGLNFANVWGSLQGDSAHARLQAYNVQNDNTNYRALRILNSTYESDTENALEFYELIDGVGTGRKVLHTGNSQKVTITADAPSDTTALWVDTANKKVKAYIDGAWTALA